MSKSIKLKNNTYIDSSSIVHNRKILRDIIYPVGSIYISVNDVNPSNLFGGTWEQLKDRFLVGAGNSYSVNATGGNSSHTHTTGDHTLTINEIPSHTHNATYSTSDGTGWESYRTGNSSSRGQKNYLNAYTGGGKAHNHGNTGSSSNIPPYLAVYMWKRTS